MPRSPWVALTASRTTLDAPVLERVEAIFRSDRARFADARDDNLVPGLDDVAHRLHGARKDSSRRFCTARRRRGLQLDDAAAFGDVGLKFGRERAATIHDVISIRREKDDHTLRTRTGKQRKTDRVLSLRTDLSW